MGFHPDRDRLRGAAAERLGESEIVVPVSVTATVGSMTGQASITLRVQKLEPPRFVQDGVALVQPGGKAVIPLRAKQVRAKGSNDGFFGGNMDAHCLATIAFCEAYGLSRAERRPGGVALSDGRECVSRGRSRRGRSPRS